MISGTLSVLTKARIPKTCSKVKYFVKCLELFIFWTSLKGDQLYTRVVFKVR